MGEFRIECYSPRIYTADRYGETCSFDVGKGDFEGYLALCDEQVVIGLETVIIFKNGCQAVWALLHLAQEGEDLHYRICPI